MRSLLLLLLSLFSINLTSQVINSGFEQWDNRIYILSVPPIIPFEIVFYEDPEGWTSLNQITESSLLGNRSLVEESNDAVEGMLSARLTSDTFTIPLLGSVILPGLLVNGEIEFDVLSVIGGGNPFDLSNIGTPYNQRPSKISGYMKYNPVGADSCIISVLLSSQGEPVGAGIFISGQNTDTNFVFFEAPINYNSCTIPDTVTIIISSSSFELGNLTSFGSTLWIDSFDLFVPSNPVNTRPVAEDDSAVTTIDVPITIDVLANDEDCENDTLEVNTLFNLPSNGTAMINGNGKIEYAPNSSFTGSDQFDYSVCDQEPLCDTATVFITVEASTSIYNVLEERVPKVLYVNGLESVVLKFPEGELFSIEMFDSYGRLIKIIENKTDKYQISSELENGLYFLKMENLLNGREYSERVVISR